MKAILLKEFGDPNQLYIGNRPTPTISSEEILVKVAATALNRADTLQRKGKYPPPPGASDILGLEMSGVVVAVGEEVDKWKIDDKVFGLLAGGGYAEYAVIHQDVAMEIPDNLTFIEATAIPEVYLTAFQAISYLAKLQRGERILIHAGASGVGTAAIQLSKMVGAEKIFVTASGAKHAICVDLGAHTAIDYRTQNFEEEIKSLTQNEGVDVIIDFLAAPYFQKNINCLALDGRMVMLALMGGIKVDNINLANILGKRLHIMGSTLRARSLEYKIRLARDFAHFAMEHFKTGALIPVIDSVYNWKEVAAAHQHMESNKNKGKIVLKIE